MTAGRVTELLLLSKVAKIIYTKKNMVTVLVRILDGNLEIWCAKKERYLLFDPFKAFD